MINLLPKLVNNIHLSVILSISITLGFFYYYWPWSNWYIFDDRLITLAVQEHKSSLIGSLFIMPIVYAALIFSWRKVLIFLIVILIFLLPKMVEFYGRTESIIINLCLLSLPLLIALLIKFERFWRQKEKKTMIERETERQSYIAEILGAQEEERKNISRELHDGITQDLLVIANQIESVIKKKNKRTSSEQQLEEIKQLVLKISEDTRSISFSLRPEVLSTLGLVSAIRLFTNRIFHGTSVKSRLSVSGQERNLPPDVEAHIFRMAQEALNNIRHHSNGTKAKIDLNYGDDIFEFIISDNGVGFHVTDSTDFLISQKKLGVIGMKQRAQLIHGQLEILAKPGEGTRVVFRLRV